MDFDKYLHPGEKRLMKKILETVKEYNNLQKFIKKCTFSGDRGCSNGKRIVKSLMKIVIGVHNIGLCRGPKCRQSRLVSQSAM